MEHMDSVAVAQETPSRTVIGRLLNAGRFAVLGVVLALPAHDPVLHRHPHSPIDIPRETTDDDAWLDLDSVDAADTVQLIGKNIRIARENASDLHVAIRRRNGEVELSVDGTSYRIRDTMNVNVGATIASASLHDDIVTITTTEHGTANVRWEEVMRIARMLDGRWNAETTVSTVFEPQGAALCGAIGLRRWYKGHTPGDEETYELAFDRVDAPSEEVAMDHRAP